MCKRNATGDDCLDKKEGYPIRLHIQEAAQFQSWAQRGWLSICDETERKKKD